MRNLSLFLFFLLFFAITRADGQDLITNTCGQTMYKDVCMATLNSGKATRDSTLSDLDTIVLANLSSLVKQTSEKITALMKDSSTKEALEDCSESLQDAMSQISESIKALDSKGYNDMNTWITAVMTDVDACEDSLKPESPISDRNKAIKQLCSISLSITDQLGGSEDDVSTFEDASEKQDEA